jgi:hypothetical protein
MVPAETLQPSLNAAGMQLLERREACAILGMLGVLKDFRTSSRVWGAIRRSDGLGAIDAAVDAISRAWKPQDGAGHHPVDDHVTTLLNACTAWLQEVRDRKVTDRRAPSIRTLYWQAGFAWSCDYYVQRARRQVEWNNFNHVETSANEPVELAAVHGHFYNDQAYRHAKVPPANRLLRGDSRGPILIHQSNGFQPRNIDNRWDYKPWWLGNALGDTISTTTFENLAMEAAAAAFKSGTLEGDLPQWLKDDVPKGRRRGYVYQIANITGDAVRMAEKGHGLEEVFLAIPMKCLVKCWVVDIERQTYGPIPLPIPNEPWQQGAGWELQPQPAWSLLRQTLA